MIIKITWKTTQKVGGKFLVCSVGPVRCGDLTQSTGTAPHQPQTHPAKDTHETPQLPPELGLQGEKCLYSLRIKKSCALESRTLEDSLRKAMDHDSSVGCSQLSPLDWQEKTPGVGKSIQTCEKAVS